MSALFDTSPLPGPACAAVDLFEVSPCPQPAPVAAKDRDHALPHPLVCQQAPLQQPAVLPAQPPAQRSIAIQPTAAAAERGPASRAAAEPPASRAAVQGSDKNMLAAAPEVAICIRAVRKLQLVHAEP